MSQQDRLRSLLLCSAILETAKKLEADFAKLKQSADDFRADFERPHDIRGWRRSRIGIRQGRSRAALLTGR